MNIFKFIIPIIFVVLGFILRSGKGSFLIAGYNTASKEEKEKYDEVALGKFLGNLLIAIAAIVLLTALSEIYSVTLFKFIVVAAPIMIVILVIGTIIYANTGNRFEK
ncbi:DUF3784 domain-containing protein [Clostridium sp. CS001]|uniref:DUF3784 domain-containing protein n=1 Tax=Clostridium sp. CS001 TaxID=2880648 RepID=UPI001CF5DF2F|nr:DUF3784 domain-containing protein [Clostridium sp. CS001]MCB2290048.1 DUF3784 domain-containing protein [Clostridium sp. CS001]